MDKVRHQTVSSCSIWSLKIPVRCCSFHKKQQIKQHLYSSLFVLWSVLKKGSSLPFLKKKVSERTGFKLFYYDYFFFFMRRSNPPDGISVQSHVGPQYFIRCCWKPQGQKNSCQLHILIIQMLSKVLQLFLFLSYPFY